MQHQQVSAAQIDLQEFLERYGHLHVKLLSYYRFIFTYGVNYCTSEEEVKILITVGDGSPESIYKTEITEFCRPVRLSSLAIASVEVYKVTTAGVELKTYY